jgi:hypothetical protein
MDRAPADGDTFYNNLFDRIATLSGFLVVAGYPVIVLPIDGPSLSGFHPSTIRTFASLSVSLFIATIVACQAYVSQNHCPIRTS